MLLSIRSRLELRLAEPLPGSDAHALMAHEERRQFFREHTVPANAKISSVLFLLYEENEVVYFPLIVRSKDGSVHSGQIGLPGGRYEEQDQDLAVTALRETEEEIGVRQNEIELLGKLSPIYIPPSNFIVHPYIGIHQKPPRFLNDTTEVERVVPFSLHDLLHRDMRVDKEITLSTGRTLTTPAYVHNDITIWGATAMMMSELKWLLEK